MTANQHDNTPPHLRQVLAGATDDTSSIKDQTADTANQSDYVTPPTSQILFVVFTSMVGCFDFLIYFYLADVINQAFFPALSNSWLNQLQTIGLLSAGFLSRPIGGLLIGRYGDIHGRKPALFISLSFLCAATIVTIFLPTYAQIGMLAPILFVLTRLLQGMAFGVFSPLSWVFIAEHASKHSISTYCSLAVAGLIAGNLAAVLFAKVLLSTLTMAELTSFGWRIPFVIGSVLSLVALYCWRYTKETPVFTTLKNQRNSTPRYLQVFSAFNQPLALTLSLIIAFLQASLIMVAVLLLPKLIAIKFSLPSTFTNYAILLGLIFQLIGCLFYGCMADRFGTGRALIVAATALILQALIFYNQLSYGNGDYILLLYALLGFCSGMIGLFPSILLQLFPTQVRLTSLSITYTCASAIAGTALPVALYYLTNVVSFSPALYLTFVGLTTMVLGVYLHHMALFNQLDNLQSSTISNR
ncbi:MFS transporter [Psychrobacter sp. FDAARGOS_221]|uniref:MFS transporter n=1 Tax=Psychrobacter sp. FDAARGOS_221 TaxID=1975705 RepID=UPI000BB52F97|nr:MFS transporter [Psychrobacter sp. FDAARGOS_221]PNK60075.1 MFS transporter [Psychrobacter sp. FDAARGOS_221]